MFFAAGPVEQAFTNKRAGFVPLAEHEFFFGYGSFERTLNQLEFAVTRHPFIAGERSPQPTSTSFPYWMGSRLGNDPSPGGVRETRLQPRVHRRLRAER